MFKLVISEKDQDWFKIFRWYISLQAI